MCEEYVSRESLVKCGASPECKALGEGLDWLSSHVDHYHEKERATHKAYDGATYACNTILPVWPISSVVAALFQHRPKFAGIDGYQWLIDHDERAKKWAEGRVGSVLDTKEHSVKAKVEFDVKELKEGDVVTFGLWSDAEVLAINDEKDEFAVKHHGSGSLRVWTTNGRAWDGQGKMRPITRVVRDGKQIYPVEVPKFKVGDWRQFTRGIGSRVRIAEVRADAVVYRYPNRAIEGILPFHDIETYTTPCAQFMVGDVVEWHGTRFKIRFINGIGCATLATLDGEVSIASVDFANLTLITPAPVKEAK